VEGKLNIELRGDLAGILAMSEGGQGGAFFPKELSELLAAVIET
jgi:hypothetical protein